MQRFSFELSRSAYLADFWFYGAATISLGAALVLKGASEDALALAAIVFGGFVLWSLMEYLLHRFVLHGLQPFAYWHGRHHARSVALIGAPTWASAGLFAALISLPAGVMLGWLVSCALTLGVSLGYLLYIFTHHAIHHWPNGGSWLLKRQQLHAMHHRPKGHTIQFGVTFSLWDRVFGSMAEKSV